MHVEIRFHSDHITPNDLAIFKALAALAEFAPDAPLPTAEADHITPNDLESFKALAALAEFAPDAPLPTAEADHITPNDLESFKALAALAEFAPDAPLPTAEADHGEPLRPEPTPLVEVKPARPAARKAAPKAKPAPAPEPEPVEAKPAEEPTETNLAAAKRELTEAVTKLARSGPEGRARAKKALIGAGVERVSEVKTLTVAKAVLAALAEGDEADDLA